MAVCCEPLRVGVAGLGVVAQVVHLPLLARRRDLFRLSALCDVSRTVRDQVGQRYGVAQPRRYPRASTPCSQAVSWMLFCC